MGWVKCLMRLIRLDSEREFPQVKATEQLVFFEVRCTTSLVALENDDFQWVYFVRIHRLQR
jgi:hypothetical protein